MLFVLIIMTSNSPCLTPFPPAVPSPDIVKLIQLSNSCISNPRLRNFSAVLTGGLVKLSSCLPPSCSSSCPASCTCSARPGGTDAQDCHAPSQPPRHWRSSDHHAGRAELFIVMEPPLCAGCHCVAHRQQLYCCPADGI